MSLAELHRPRSHSGGEGAKRRFPWVDDFRVDEDDLGFPCPKEEAETLHPQVDSKDLFREAASLPNSEDLQISFGRALHRYRNALVRHSPGSRSRLAEVRSSVPEQWTVPIYNIQRYLDEHPEALETITSASEFVALLKKALTSIESGTPLVAETRTVLESFDGYVDSIEGDTAYVTLESRKNGDVLYGEYSASELLARGIHEQTRFLCETVKGGGGERVHFAPLPKLAVTDEEARAIANEMREAFPGDDDCVIEY